MGLSKDDKLIYEIIAEAGKPLSKADINILYQERVLDLIAGVPAAHLDPKIDESLERLELVGLAVSQDEQFAPSVSLQQTTLALVDLVTEVIELTAELHAKEKARQEESEPADETKEKEGE